MWATILKISLTIGILTLLFIKIPLDELTPYFTKLQAGWFLLAFLAQLIAYLLGAIRWGLLMKSLKFIAPDYFYLKKTFIANLFNQLLPTSIGGDAYKIIVSSKLNLGKKQAVFGVLIDRLYGVTGLALISLFSLPTSYYLLPQNIFSLILTFNCLFYLGLSVLISISLLRMSFKHFSLKLVSELSHQLAASVSSTRDAAIKLFLAITPNLLTIYTFLLLAYAMNIHTQLSKLLSIIPTLLIVLLVPTSLGGWGMREGAFIFLGSLIGLSKAESFSISLLFGLISLLSSLPGLYFYWHKRLLT